MSHTPRTGYECPAALWSLLSDAHGTDSIMTSSIETDRLNALPPLTAHDAVLTAASALDNGGPAFGVELEFVAGSERVCNYSQEDFIRAAEILARHVGFNGKWCEFKPEDNEIRWASNDGGIWRVSGDLCHPVAARRATAFEFVSPVMQEAGRIFILLQSLYTRHSDTLGVHFPCYCGWSSSIAVTNARELLCGDHCGVQAVMGIAPGDCNQAGGHDHPTFHVHVDATGMCEEDFCNALVNLLIFHERHEHVLRRLFPTPAVQMPLWAAAPSLLQQLGNLRSNERTRRRVRSVFHEHNATLQSVLCRYRQPRKVNPATGLCHKKHVRPELVYRYWSLNVAAMIDAVDPDSDYGRRRRVGETVEFRGAAMGPSLHALLRVQLYRQLVRHIRTEGWAIVFGGIHHYHPVMPMRFCFPQTGRVPESMS
jgi:hypothetical protein